MCTDNARGPARASQRPCAHLFDTTVRLSCPPVQAMRRSRTGASCRRRHWAVAWANMSEMSCYGWDWDALTKHRTGEAPAFTCASLVPRLCCWCSGAQPQPKVRYKMTWPGHVTGCNELLSCSTPGWRREVIDTALRCSRRALSDERLAEPISLP